MDTIWNDILSKLKVDTGYECIDRTLQNDAEFISEAFKIRGSVLNYASYQIRNDPAIIKAAVIYHRNRNLLVYASEELKDNEAFMLDMAKFDINTLSWASKRLINDKKFMLNVMQIDTSEDVTSFYYASRHLRNDRQFVLAAIRVNGKTLLCAGCRLRYSKEMKAIAKTDTRYVILHKEYVRQKIICCGVLVSFILFLLSCYILSVSFEGGFAVVMASFIPLIGVFIYDSYN